MSLYCADNCRTAEQLAEMQRLEAAGLCLFCPDGLRLYIRDKILWQTDHWFVTPNKFPYRGTAVHLLVVPNKHVNDIIDLEPDAQIEFWNVLAMIRKRFELKYYGLGIRSGDCRFTGGTIAHVHAHVLVGDTASAAEIRMRFSSLRGNVTARPPGG